MKLHHIIFSILSTVLILIGALSTYVIQNAFKSYEHMSNAYYAKSAYHLISDYIFVQQTRYTDGLFTQNDFEKILNALLPLTDPLRQDISPEISHPFDHYYHAKNGVVYKNNMPEDLSETLIARQMPSNRAQIVFAPYQEKWYIGVSYQNKDEHYMLATNIEKLFNLSTLHQFVETSQIQMFADMPEINSSAVPMPGGGWIAHLGDYNALYLPIKGNNHQPFYLYVPVEKPALVQELKDKTYQILLTGVSLFAFLLIAIGLLIRRLSKQIESLVEQVVQIAKGDYKRKLPRGKTSEMKALEKSIHHMAQTIEEKIETLEIRNDEILLVLIEALDAKDAYTKGHADRVSTISIQLAKAIGYTQTDALKRAALMHDIGKISIPEAILNKNGPLTEEEFKIIQTHPQTGYDILCQSAAFRDIIDIVLFHHERFDGKGYPAGLKAHAIPIGAQILCTADVFDALTSDRPYRSALSAKEAIRLMKNQMASHFNPELVLALEKIVI